MSTENNLINIFVQKLNSILDNPCLVNIIIKRIDELVTNDYYNKNLHKNIQRNLQNNRYCQTQMYINLYLKRRYKLITKNVKFD